MTKPQRHRLLQGFPAVPAMVRAVPDEGPTAGLVRRLDGSLKDELFDEARFDAILARGDRSKPAELNVDRSRDLIVGVIPHTQCVTGTPACGFCTFPSDRADSRARGQMVGAVAADIGELAGEPQLEGRRVHAVYLGGGTANLSSPEEIALILSALRSRLVLDDAELTLEGTPALFDRFFSSHLGALSKERVAHRRISMGVQTFDPRALAMMGRERFGDAALVRALVKKCRKLEVTTSADLLFNLPGQTLEQMEHDVETAIAAGLDQICLYHLVLYEGLGTPWANAPELLRTVPDNERALEHWLRLRERLLAAGYEQSTLTNFERADVRHGPKRFRYEQASFDVDRTDAIGFGPLSLTTFIDWPQRRALKLLRRKHVGTTSWSGGDLAYHYDEAGLKLLMLTRGLATTRVDGRTWNRRFGSTLATDFSEALAATTEAGLIARDGESIALTPRGQFFADSVVSIFALSTDRPFGAGVSTATLLSEQPQSANYISMG